MTRKSWPSVLNINNWRLWIHKKKSLLNLINNEPDINKIYLYAKHPSKIQYQLSVNKTESTGLKYLNDPIAFIDYTNDMDDIYENAEEYNPNKNQNMLIVFDNMIADILSNSNWIIY